MAGIKRADEVAEKHDGRGDTLAEHLPNIFKYAADGGDDDYLIYGLRFAPDKNGNGLLTVSVRSKSDRLPNLESGHPDDADFYVAFVGGRDFFSCLAKLEAALDEGTLTVSPDRYAEQRNKKVKKRVGGKA